ncbi:MAG: YdeI/OmpD-associated family protein [Bacteroidota bacterium]|nr:YdeI/OmpD-associated family protein [Bacteroidota bacterium]
MEKPLVNKKFRLEKFNGKGGWTYAVIPGIAHDKTKSFGWRRVKGFIDDYEIKNFNLMPMGKGKLMLPVKTAIRKKIGKEEGDWIKVVLYPDSTPTKTPKELLLCLKDDPSAYKNFLNFTDAERKAFIDWIYSAKADETKVKRIAKTIDKASRGEKFTSPPMTPKADRA